MIYSGLLPQLIILIFYMRYLVKFDSLLRMCLLLNFVYLFLLIAMRFY